MHRYLQYSLLVLGTALIVVGKALKATADSTGTNPHGVVTSSVFNSVKLVTLPEDIFTPYLELIQQSLPGGWQMRLPKQVMLSYSAQDKDRRYNLRVSSSTSGTGLTVSVLSCENDAIACLVGSFTVDTETNTEVQRAFQRHQAAATPITLADGIQGYYLLEGFISNPPSQFSSVIWKQDGLIYQVRFAALERQNILYMARSMAINTPIPSTSTVAEVTGMNRSQEQANPRVLFIAPEMVFALDSRSQVSASLPENSIPPPLSNSQQPSPEDLCTPESGEKPETIIAIRQQIKVKGNTVLNAEIEAIIQPYNERTIITREELVKLQDNITKLYLENGYLTSKACLKKTDGVVGITVIEGRLVEIRVEGQERLNPNYIYNRIEQINSIPINIDQLEDQLRLLRVNPLFDKIEAILSPGGKPGESILVVRVQEAEPFTARLSVDNYSPPSVGSERFGISFLARNLSGNGDEFAGSYRISVTGGAELFDLSYLAPINSRDSSILFRVAINQNEITESPFDALGIRAENQLWEIIYRQPLLHTPRQEFALSFGFTFQDGQTFVFDRLPTPFGIGPDEDGVSRTSVFSFGQDYIRRDRQGAWALRSQFKIGTGLFNATTNQGAIPDGEFFSWLGQVQRVQQLGKDNLLMIEADLQLTPNSLLPAQQFIIGGGQSVRGYRQNARTGDNGFRLAIEDRITIKRDAAGDSQIEIVPFFQMGAVWNMADNPNKLPEQNFLIGAGIGLRWEPFLDIHGLSLKLDYAIPFIDLEDQRNNLQDQGFYFNLNYQPLLR